MKTIVAVLLMLVSLGVAAQGDAQKAYPCRNEQEGKGVLTPGLEQKIEALRMESDLHAREQSLSQLIERAASPYEKGLLQIEWGYLRAVQGRDDEATAALRPSLPNPFMPRLTLDQVREVLARLALRRKDSADAVAMLEPVFLANCARMPESAYFALADAYLQRSRSADALAVLQKASIKKSGDPDWWMAVRAELLCKLQGPRDCVGHIASLNLEGGLSPAFRDVADQLLAKAVEAPEAADMVAAARGQDLIDAQGRLVDRPPLRDLQEGGVLKAVQPHFPREAALQGLFGFVQLLIHIDAEGKATDVTVLQSSPKGVFDAAAKRAAWKTLYRPQMENGVAVPSRGSMMFHFRLAER